MSFYVDIFRVCLYTVSSCLKGAHERMNKFKKWISLALTLLLVVSMVGCGKEPSDKKQPVKKTEAVSKVDMSSYIGTWKGSDHDGENVVHYLIFDKDGYWRVYMNYDTLKKAIKQLPDRYVSFKVTFAMEDARNNSDHTGCVYEYVKYDADEFSLDKDGKVVSKSMTNVLFEKVSEKTGEPEENIVEQAQDLFIRARKEALEELEKK